MEKHVPLSWFKLVLSITCVFHALDFCKALVISSSVFPLPFLNQKLNHLIHTSLYDTTPKLDAIVHRQLSRMILMRPMSGCFLTFLYTV